MAAVDETTISVNLQRASPVGDGESGKVGRYSSVIEQVSASGSARLLKQPQPLFSSDPYVNLPRPNQSCLKFRGPSTLRSKLRLSLFLSSNTASFHQASRDRYELVRKIDAQLDPKRAMIRHLKRPPFLEKRLLVFGLGETLGATLFHIGFILFALIIAEHRIGPAKNPAARNFIQREGTLAGPEQIARIVKSDLIEILTSNRRSILVKRMARVYYADLGYPFRYRLLPVIKKQPNHVSH
jgi:hypothetical protein